MTAAGGEGSYAGNGGADFLAVSNSYDALGRLVWANDASSSTTQQFAYDDLDRVTDEVQTAFNLNLARLHSTYDSLGRRASLAAHVFPSTPTSGGTADFKDDYTYNDLDQVTSIWQHGVGGNSVATKVVQFGYNDAGRLAHLYRFNYELAHPETLVEDGAGAVATTDYTWGIETEGGTLRPDLLGWIVNTHTQSSYATADSADLDTLYWSYDMSGRIGESGSTTAGAYYGYTYDGVGRLKNVTRGGYLFEVSEQEGGDSYFYAPNGTRLATLDDPEAVVPETSLNDYHFNRVWEDENYAYSYDAEGNLISKKELAGDEIETFYEYDPRNRLINVHWSDTFQVGDLVMAPHFSWSIDYGYDSADQMVLRSAGVGLEVESSWTSGGIRNQQFVWDNGGGLGQIVLDFEKMLNDLSPPTSDGFSLAHRYLNGPGVDQVLAQDTIAHDVQTAMLPEGTYWLLSDYQNTVRDLADYDGDLVAHYRYDTYGTPTAIIGSQGAAMIIDPRSTMLDAWSQYDANSISKADMLRYFTLSFSGASTGSLLLYTGLSRDPLTGLQYNRARWYDSQTGQFTAEDPAFDGANWFSYTANDPTNHTDPTGMWEWSNVGDFAWGVAKGIGTGIVVGAGVAVIAAGAAVVAPVLGTVVVVGAVGAGLYSLGNTAVQVYSGEERNWYGAKTGNLLNDAQRADLAGQGVGGLIGGPLGYKGTVTIGAKAFPTSTFAQLPGAPRAPEVKAPSYVDPIEVWEGEGGASSEGPQMANAPSSVRSQVLANIAESQSARASSNFDTYLAREAQVQSGYAADVWNATTLNQGSIVYGGVPGQSAFYINFATVRASGLNQPSLFQSLQVAPHPVYGYRPGIQAYRVMSDITVPGGTALANPALGGGGGAQLFINNYNSVLAPIRSFPLTP